jgi:hypothetical protein
MAKLLVYLSLSRTLHVVYDGKEYCGVRVGYHGYREMEGRWIIMLSGVRSTIQDAVEYRVVYSWCMPLQFCVT